ncbi:hypothetical protein RBJ15_11375 [Pantoea sp. BS_4]|uniref:hypothetical protein n=1 Tax=unclassified Pantoea TaxID=2630326 RepID=UPI0035C1194E
MGLEIYNDKNITISVFGLAIFNLNVVASSGCISKIVEQIPSPFIIKKGYNINGKTINIEHLDVASIWPDDSNFVGVYRSGLHDPFPWYVEHRDACSFKAWLHDESTNERALLEINNNLNTIKLSTKQGECKWPIRIIKNIFSAKLLSEGWVPIHASAFIHDGNIIVCNGSRGSGKSTLSFLMSLYKKAKFISDDMIFIRQSQEKNDWIILGWPRRIGIRSKTLELCFGSKKTQEIKSKLRRNVLPSNGHPRGERFAFDIDELNNILDITTLGYHVGPLYIANIRVGDRLKINKKWCSENNISNIKAKGEDIRFLIDFFDIYQNHNIKNDIEKKFDISYQHSDITLPYDILTSLDDITESLSL